MGLICGKRLFPKRSTCWGTSRSSATSLMVRKASGALSKARLLFQSNVERGTGRLLFALAGRTGTVGVDALLQDRRRLEHHDAARQDRHLGAGLRIAADALAFLAHHEGSERGQLYRLALL